MYGPGSTPPPSVRYALIGQPETLIIVERVETAPLLLRGLWKKGLETVLLKGLESAWGLRIHLSR